MLLIFIFSLYIIVSVSCCINNNLKILVAYNKQVDWAQSMSHCGSVGQLGQACSCVFILRPKLRGQKLLMWGKLMAVAWDLFFSNNISKMSILVYLKYFI